MLRPQVSATRELINLDGLWQFKVDFNDEGFANNWASKPLATELQAPVPASYNDIFTDTKIREHSGWVFYQRVVRVPRGWGSDRVLVRADSATHEGVIFVNGKEVVRHVGGYMPFQTDITDLVSPGEEFTLTIAVSNVLTNETIPPGRVVTKDDGVKQQTYLHDFYNYGGLHRSIWLCSVPTVSIYDVTVITDFEGTTGTVAYEVATTKSADVKVSLIDQDGKVVATGEGAIGNLSIANVKLWQPGNAYLYKLKVEASVAGATCDEYEINVGVRTVKVEGNKFLINNEPFYFTG
ncbi:MAG: sugar-binding domain-containing protein, partial [Micrococcales bacterium]